MAIRLSVTLTASALSKTPWNTTTTVPKSWGRCRCYTVLNTGLWLRWTCSISNSRGLISTRKSWWNELCFAFSHFVSFSAFLDISRNMVMRELAPQLHIPWSIPMEAEDIPIVPTTSGTMYVEKNKRLTNSEERCCWTAHCVYYTSLSYKFLKWFFFFKLRDMLKYFCT